MQARLEELKKELEMGQSELDKVERQRAYLHETLLRIGGAVQVLEELLAQMQPAEGRNGTGPSEPQPEPARTPTVDARNADINRTT
jgi:hypothetical protein